MQRAAKPRDPVSDWWNRFSAEIHRQDASNALTWCEQYTRYNLDVIFTADGDEIPAGNPEAAARYALRHYTDQHR